MTCNTCDLCGKAISGHWNICAECFAATERQNVQRPEPLPPATCSAGDVPIQTADDPAFDEWNRLKQQLDSSNWTASEASTFYAFFLHGWFGRANQAAYQHSPNDQADR